VIITLNLNNNTIMKSLYKIILLISVALCFSSCLDDLDFEQTEEFEIEPTAAVSLLNFDLNQNELLDNNILEVPTINEETLLPSFQNALIQEDLDILALEFELSNSFEGSYTIDVVFLDESGEETYAVETIELPEDTPIFSYTEDVVILDNPDFLNSKMVSVVITYNGESIDNDVDASLIFKSAALLYF